MPRPAPRSRPRLGRGPALYWLAALAFYGAMGAFFQPFFLLGFWQSIPLLFLFTWLAGKLFGGNGPVTTADDPGEPGRPSR